MERNEVYKLIDTEREYQDKKWKGHKHEVGAYILLLEDYVLQARIAWVQNSGDHYALDNIRKIAGIAVHCMEEHETPARDLS